MGHYISPKFPAGLILNVGISTPNRLEHFTQKQVRTFKIMQICLSHILSIAGKGVYFRLRLITFYCITQKTCIDGVKSIFNRTDKQAIFNI